VYAPSEEKSDDSKGSFNDELEKVFYHFPKCHIKILLADLNAGGGGRIFSNRQLGMKTYIKILMFMVLKK